MNDYIPLPIVFEMLMNTKDAKPNLLSIPFDSLDEVGSNEVFSLIEFTTSFWRLVNIFNKFFILPRVYNFSKHSLFYFLNKT
jgi:hypothetical protein